MPKIRTKKCCQCKIILPYSAFYKQEGHPRFICKNCSISRSKANYQENKAARLEKIKIWNKNNQLKRKIHSRTYSMKHPHRHKGKFMDSIGQNSDISFEF